MFGGIIIFWTSNFRNFSTSEASCNHHHNQYTEHFCNPQDVPRAILFAAMLYSHAEPRHRQFAVCDNAHLSFKTILRHRHLKVT